MINKQEVRIIAVLSAIFALRMLGLCMLLPIFAVEALRYKAASSQLIGVAVGSYGLAQAVLQIPFGWLSDRYGRKPLIVAGLGIIVLGSLISAMATSIYGLIIGRILQGCGSIGSVVLATLTENVRTQVRTSAMAILGATIGMSFAAALVLGPWLNQYIGLAGVFMIIAVLAAICAALVLTLPAQPQTQHAMKSKLWYNMRNTQLAETNLGVFVLHASLAALFLIVPSLLQNVGIVSNKVWQFYTLTICTAMLVAWRLIKRGEQQQNLAQLQRLAIFCLLFAEVLLYTVNSWFYIAGSMVLFFSAFCVLEASLPALVAKHATAENRGAAMGLYSCLQFFGVFVGGVAGGWLHEHMGAFSVLSFCILLVVSWLMLNIYLKAQSATSGSRASLVNEG